jgi:hypothetical protein
MCIDKSCTRLQFGRSVFAVLAYLWQGRQQPSIYLLQSDPDTVRQKSRTDVATAKSMEGDLLVC